MSLNAGLTRIEKQILRAYGRVLPKSTYTVLLLELRPAAIDPGGERDYFLKKQVATWETGTLAGRAADRGRLLTAGRARGFMRTSSSTGITGWRPRRGPAGRSGC
ncbi:hypothetical protein [Jiangella anatolica]|uniref:hypothetical protein n=1 Tax=Jiangella anatolica TaxID=2670374 RepID=UPI0011B60F89|nr:hypothetical protein [Jiangella anatolica]